MISIYVISSLSATWCAHYHLHTCGDNRRLQLKNLSSRVDLLDYKAHDHNKITHRERDEHIATGKALNLEGELLPPHHGSQQQRWRWRWSRWRWLRGQLPIPAGCRNRDPYSP